MYLRPIHRSFRFTAYRPCLAQRSFNTARLTRNRAQNILEKSYSARIIGRSSISSISIILIVAGCLLSGSLLLSQTAAASLDREGTTNPEYLLKAEGENSMVGAILPGRPGNLTKDQEVKLQELWTAALKVFGVASTSANGIEKEDEEAGAAASEKKKKKRSLFGRKHPNESGEGGLSNSSTDQEDKYGQTKEFHQVVATQSPDDLRKAFWSMVKHDHPDALLLRFLRARKWDVQNALAMLVSTMHWRLQEMKVDDDLMRNGEAAAVAESLGASTAAAKKEGHDFISQLRLGKSFFHGTDREGRPICFVRVRLHRQGEQTETSLEKFTVYGIETARLLLAGNVDTAAIIFDMTGFSMANMDYTPVKFMIKCFEANYPESLGVVLVHKSPWIFQGIWAIIKNWLDPVVASKVHFTKSVDELTSFIARDHIIAELGGDDPWTYHYEEPHTGENDRMKDVSTRDRLLDERAAVVRDFEAVTRAWVAGEGAKGEGREEIAERLRVGYWALDPYVRARSIYDRTGIIGEGGKIHHHNPPQRDRETAPSDSQNGPLPAGQQRADDLD